MPELPDITVYCDAIAQRAVGATLDAVRLNSPFLLRTVEPALTVCHGRIVREVRRLGKRVVLGLDGDLFLVIHLMIAGRLHWRKRGCGFGGKGGLAAFDLPGGTLLLTEAGTKRRASLHVVAGEAGLSVFDLGGLPPLTATPAEVAVRLRGERHTLKRSLTDPRLFDGVGGAFADEILFEARLSPVTWSDGVDDAGVERLTAALRTVLASWVERLRAERGDGFPEHVTAFRPEMQVHGRFGQPCRACGDPVQRIVHDDRETNYCCTCQTGGRLLRDRAMSQLLKSDWPATLDELMARRPTPVGGS
ncbi:MAG TPA: DNA-formamidopyrimidine glycosylase family protein [Myxococcota bacterium]|nr:DNA-formamidopyrimidine glycosylase family protein [Myxococcota bacterium]